MKMVGGKLVPDDTPSEPEDRTHTNEHLHKTVPEGVHSTPPVFAVGSDSPHGVRTEGVSTVHTNSDPVLVPPTATKAWPKPEVPLVNKVEQEDVKGRFVKEVTPEKKELHDRVVAILADYGGMEANIPVNHEYWDLLNRFRATK